MSPDLRKNNIVVKAEHIAHRKSGLTDKLGTQSKDEIAKKERKSMLARVLFLREKLSSRDLDES